MDHAKAVQVCCPFYERLGNCRRMFAYELNLVFTEDAPTRRMHLLANMSQRNLVHIASDLANMVGLPFYDHATEEHKRDERNRVESGQQKH